MTDFESMVASKLEVIIGLLLSNKTKEPVTLKVASDADLDGKYGNPVVKDPPSWVKAEKKSYTGATMSECPADYLEEVAGLLEWQAKKDDEAGKVTKDGKPTSGYKRMDAARARGWAKRITATLDFPA